MTKGQIYIIGNWKSNKNRQEVESWFALYSREAASQKLTDNIEAVIAPSYIHLELAKNLIEKYHLRLKLSAQDISPFTSGSFTGQVSASMLKDYVEYVIIGHSERRKNFGEDDIILTQKVKQTKEAGLASIYCIQDENTFIPPYVNIIAYEPVWAIGSGKSDSPDNANRVIGLVKQKHPDSAVIYGGSVTPDNIASFITQEYVDGVLLGGASLNPATFSQMIKKVNSL